MTTDRRLIPIVDTWHGCTDPVSIWLGRIMAATLATLAVCLVAVTILTITGGTR